jgi:hypothetical protein
MKPVSWQTPEYVHRQKSSDWYWVVGIVAGGIAITSIIFGNIIFALLVAVGAFVLCLFASRPPEIITVGINDKGINVADAFYPFRSIKSFSIDESHHDGVRLIIRSDRPLLPYVTVPFPGDKDAVEELVSILSPKAKQEPFEESPLHLFFERLWF